MTDDQEDPKGFDVEPYWKTPTGQALGIFGLVVFIILAFVMWEPLASFFDIFF